MPERLGFEALMMLPMTMMMSNGIFGMHVDTCVLWTFKSDFYGLRRKRRAKYAALFTKEDRLVTDGRK